MTAMSPAITPADRLTFTFFLAAALHAAMILGVTFTYLDRSSSTHTMEVTLAQHSSNNQPKKADFLAQFNQQGSGTLEEKALTTTTTEAEFFDTVVRETTPVEEAQTRAKTTEQKQTVITTTKKLSPKAATRTDPAEQVDDGSEDDEVIGDDFESMYKGEISKSGTPILPSKRARKIPEKIQVAAEDLAELTAKAEPEVDVNVEQEADSKDEDVSLDQIAESEAETTEANPEDSDTTNN